jgi:ABC-type sulfate transport system substrate-binding protein
MRGTSDERHLVPSPGEHGTVKATYGACTDNSNVVKSGSVQDVTRFVEKLKLISIFEVHAVQRSAMDTFIQGGIDSIMYALPNESKFPIYRYITFKRFHGTHVSGQRSGGGLDLVTQHNGPCFNPTFFASW